jgi:hypothetical protein
MKQEHETQLPSVSGVVCQAPKCLLMLQSGEKQPHCSIRRSLSADETYRGTRISFFTPPASIASRSVRIGMYSLFAQASLNAA